MAGHWRILLISPNRKMISELTPLLSQQLPAAEVSGHHSYPLRASLNELIASVRPTMCFLDMASDQDRALTLVSELLGLDSNLPIIALLPANDPDFILRCLRRGALEFLLQPFTADQLQPAIERVAKLQPVGSPGQVDSRIYCVIPAKGACGATTLAYNLAYQWRKATNHRVLLADLDPLTGTMSFQLKTKSNYSFLDVISHAHHLDSDLWKSMILTANGIDVLLSPENLVQGISDLKEPAEILQFSRQAYDTVILDIGGVYGDWSLSLARLCDEVLLVTTNELPALQATQRALTYLDQSRIPRSKVKLVVNRYHKDVGLSREVIGTALQMEVFHVLPSDYETVNRALLDGKPIVSASSFGKSVISLVELLGGKASGAASAQKKSSPFDGLFSLFGKR